MRLVPQIKSPRPFRHTAPEDLFLLALIGDGVMREAIEHELDLRRAKRIAGRIPLSYFAETAAEEESEEAGERW
jgi:hypothetical protein